MFTDLIDLYRGKNMHDKALELLKECALRLLCYPIILT